MLAHFACRFDGLGEAESPLWTHARLEAVGPLGIFFPPRSGEDAEFVHGCLSCLVVLDDEAVVVSDHRGDVFEFVEARDLGAVVLVVFADGFVLGVLAADGDGIEFDLLVSTVLVVHEVVEQGVQALISEVGPTGSNAVDEYVACNCCNHGLPFLLRRGS